MYRFKIGDRVRNTEEVCKQKQWSIAWREHPGVVLNVSVTGRIVEVFWEKNYSVPIKELASDLELVQSGLDVMLELLP